MPRSMAGHLSRGRCDCENMAEHHALLTEPPRGLATCERVVFLLLIRFLYEELVRPLIWRGLAISRSVHAHFPDAGSQLRR